MTNPPFASGINDAVAHDKAAIGTDKVTCGVLFRNIRIWVSAVATHLLIHSTARGQAKIDDKDRKGDKENVIQ